jgi:hypothetical protein
VIELLTRTGIYGTAETNVNRKIVPVFKKDAFCHLPSDATSLSIFWFSPEIAQPPALRQIQTLFQPEK